MHSFWNVWYNIGRLWCYSSCHYQVWGDSDSLFDNLLWFTWTGKHKKENKEPKLNYKMALKNVDDGLEKSLTWRRFDDGREDGYLPNMF